MDLTLKAVFFVVAVVLFLVDAVINKGITRASVFGFASFTTPFAWEAVEAI